jgi:branched-chain amino acid transport system ATP-binding protein
MSEPLLVVDGLHKAFGGVIAVDRVSFELGAGEIVALIGPNGAGKSTCFNLINGQLRPDRGRVLLDAADIAGRPARAVWSLGVGRTFQVAATFGSMSVRDNLLVALWSRAGVLMRLWRAPLPALRIEAERLLERVGLVAQADTLCASLSYGDLKTVDLALALAGAPRLLLLDEPTAGLAAAERAALMALVRAQARAHRIGVLFTEHSMDVVFSVADRILVMAGGRLIAAGDPATVRADPVVQAAYFGAALDPRQRIRSDPGP